MLGSLVFGPDDTLGVAGDEKAAVWDVSGNRIRAFGQRFGGGTLSGGHVADDGKNSEADSPCANWNQGVSWEISLAAASQTNACLRGTAR